MSERKPYIEWTASDHYRASVEFMEAIVGVGSAAATASTEQQKFAGEVIDDLMKRAQIHATLACVDPRIRTMAEAEENSDG